MCLLGFWWWYSLSSTCHCWQGYIESQRAAYEGANSKFIESIYSAKKESYSQIQVSCFFRMECERLMTFYVTVWLSILMLTRKTMLWFALLLIHFSSFILKILLLLTKVTISALFFMSDCFIWRWCNARNDPYWNWAFHNLRGCCWFDTLSPS